MSTPTTPGTSPVSVHVEPSATLAIKSKMAALKKAGVDTIGLGAGELKFSLAAHIRKSFRFLAKKMALGYTAAPGLEELRHAVAFKNKMDYGIDHDPNSEIMITNGGKGALLALLLTTFAGKNISETFDGRDEALYVGPYWLSHKPLCDVSQAVMKVVDCPASQDYKITPEQLRAAITDKTKYVVLTSPHNPGGTSYTEEEWEALAEVLREFPGVYVVTEDMYEHYVYDGQKRSHLLNVAPDLKDRVISINCFSKSDEMAGERVGIMTGPKKIIGPVKALNSNIAGNAPVIGQYLGISAILGYRQLKKAFKDPEAFKEQFTDQNKRQKLVNAFQRISAIRDKKIPVLEGWRDRVLHELEGTRLLTPRPGGSFYAFPSVEQLKGLRFPEDLKLADGLTEEKLEKLGLKSWAGREITCAADFAEAAMVHAGVGIVPGEDFEAPDSFRIAYVEERAVEAAQRLADLANILEQPQPTGMAA